MLDSINVYITPQKDSGVTSWLEEEGMPSVKEGEWSLISQIDGLSFMQNISLAGCLDYKPGPVETSCNSSTYCGL